MYISLCNGGQYHYSFLVAKSYYTNACTQLRTEKRTVVVVGYQATRRYDCLQDKEHSTCSHEPQNTREKATS